MTTVLFVLQQRDKKVEHELFFWKYLETFRSIIEMVEKQLKIYNNSTTITYFKGTLKHHLKIYASQ